MPDIRPLGAIGCDFPAGTVWRTLSGYALVFATDGNLALISPILSRLWESGTRGCGGQILSMQSDGNLVIYNATRSTALWASDTAGHPGAFLSVQEDGNVVIYTNSQIPVWATRTAREMIDGPQQIFEFRGAPPATVIPLRPVT